MNKFDSILQHIRSLREDISEREHPDYGYLLRLHESWDTLEDALILAATLPSPVPGTGVADQLLALAARALGLPPEAGVLEFVTECKARIDGPRIVTKQVQSDSGETITVAVPVPKMAVDQLVASLTSERDSLASALKIANDNTDGFRRDCEAAEERAEAAEGAYKAANSAFEHWKGLADDRQAFLSEIAFAVETFPERQYLTVKIRGLVQMKKNLDDIGPVLEAAQTALGELL